MAVHEITEHPDGSVSEYHEFTEDEWDVAVRRLTSVLPDGLAVSDLPDEVRSLDPDSLVEFFQVAH